jgi:hypothetical protein
MTASSVRDRVTPTRPRGMKSIRLNLYVYPVLVLALFLGSIQVSQAAGWWSTSGKMTGTGEKIQATGANPSEIKGWMTISDVITAYKVPKDEFYAQFKLPSDLPVETPMNKLESSAPGFSTDAVRTWLAARLTR